MKKGKPYLNAVDWHNVFIIGILVIICLQFTARLFFINSVVFVIVDIASILIFLGAIFALIQSFRKSNKLGEFITEEEATQIAERYIREHKLSRKTEEQEAVKAFNYFLNSKNISILEKDVNVLEDNEV